jgi:hypothetical protein
MAPARVFQIVEMTCHGSNDLAGDGFAHETGIRSIDLLQVDIKADGIEMFVSAPGSQTSHAIELHDRSDLAVRS